MTSIDSPHFRLFILYFSTFPPETPVFGGINFQVLFDPLGQVNGTCFGLKYSSPAGFIHSGAMK
jgi:hypothetical protein